MTLNASRMRGVSLLSAGIILIVMFAAAPSAQRGRRADVNAGVPAATNAILENPNAYYGKAVTISAGVEQILSKTTFLVDQRKAVGAHEVQAIGKPILVIAPYLTAPLDRNHYLLMRGEMVKFDAAA